MLGDTWRWVKPGGYLAKTVWVVDNNSEETANIDEESALQEPSDPAILLPARPGITLEFHVIYSTTYACPVLYFYGHTSAGTGLSLEDIRQTVNGHMPDLDGEKRTEYDMPVVSQKDHPILGNPFYFIHPCHTADVTAEMLEACDSDANYFVFWLSLVGQLFAPLRLVEVGYVASETCTDQVPSQKLLSMNAATGHSTGRITQ
ncbi:hypothetical protein SpCBS45565_g04570 [Spizellomyces sp. 'palustris']|nr:hypothetical protein SpCBS45565_g04570 [Spizellomyces sp. 'palustris']